MLSSDPHAETQRWELYRLLAEPLRLRLLALTAAEELTVGELAELVREGQPNVSRQVAALRKAGLLLLRKQGTRSFVRARAGLEEDPVVADGLRAGRGLCEGEGSLARIAEVVAAREEGAREYFAREHGGRSVEALPPELPVYLQALGSLLGRFQLAVDVGTGDGGLLDALAPLSERVIAVDREQVQLSQARARVAARGYDHVEFVQSEYDAAGLREQILARGGASVVCASRVLHHAAQPVRALGALAALLAPGGSVVVIDYQAHDDETLRARQADLWLGFGAAELASLATRVGLQSPQVVPLRGVRSVSGLDEHLQWHALIAQSPAGSQRRPEGTEVHRIATD